ncbi:hypothetical protein CDAR_32021 [Caerostris darwini]|uniref:Uncharacterized protein n=1 Tax=Caerostris darwini TaxID=1538125 RepID=A0AAV4RP11_9ARAC|nr:hypothetical protein CDAR_32021 [Caerostris darwini]
MMHRRLQQQQQIHLEDPIMEITGKIMVHITTVQHQRLRQQQIHLKDPIMVITCKIMVLITMVRHRRLSAAADSSQGPSNGNNMQNNGPYNNGAASATSAAADLSQGPNNGNNRRRYPFSWIRNRSRNNQPLDGSNNNGAPNTDNNGAASAAADSSQGPRK